MLGVLNIFAIKIISLENVAEKYVEILFIYET
ncbi:hypothetical protein TDB9533_00253 [Thalassocella blandensis]|nr:hypothetical protein TDB9533_00253 [Thalassocella blandensis]